MDRRRQHETYEKDCERIREVCSIPQDIDIMGGRVDGYYITNGFTILTPNEINEYDSKNDVDSRLTGMVDKYKIDDLKVVIVAIPLSDSCECCDDVVYGVPNNDCYRLRVCGHVVHSTHIQHTNDKFHYMYSNHHKKFKGYLCPVCKETINKSDIYNHIIE